MEEEIEDRVGKRLAGLGFHMPHCTENELEMMARWSPLAVRYRSRGAVELRAPKRRSVYHLRWERSRTHRLGIREVLPHGHHSRLRRKIQNRNRSDLFRQSIEKSRFRCNAFLDDLVHCGRLKHL